MKDVYIEEPVRGMLLKYVKEEDLLAFESGDSERISNVKDKEAKAKYEMAIKIMEGLLLCGDREFDRLVEEKARRYRDNDGKAYMMENYGKNKEVV